MQRILSWACVAVALAVLPARAETYRFEDAHLRFDKPDGWHAEERHEQERRVLHLDQTDEHIQLTAFRVDADDLDGAYHGLRHELERFIHDIRDESEPRHTERHDLRRIEIEGKGKIEDREVEWMACLVGVEHPVLFLAFGHHDALDGHRGEVHGIFESIERDHEH
jgi:hypothetical protein